jgi:hypothetical protein
MTSAAKIGDAFGERNAGVVAALDDRTMQEIVDRDLAVERGKHRRAARGRATLAPGVLADPVLVGQLDIARLDGVEDDLGRHQLHHAGGRTQLVGILFPQHAAGGRLDQDRGRRVAVEAVILGLLGALDALVGGVKHPAPAEADRQNRRQQPARDRTGGEPGVTQRSGKKCHGDALRTAF